jgi:hypothetical protein
MAILTLAIYFIFYVDFWVFLPDSGHPYSVLDPVEEYDVLLTDGETALGLVRIRKQGIEYCVVMTDVMKTLGYQRDVDKEECLTIEATFDRYGIPLKLQISKVELMIDRGFSYPAKDYRLAMERVNRAAVEPTQNERYINGYRPSILPESRRVDLTVWSQNHLPASPEIKTTMAGDLLGGSFLISGQAARHSSNKRYTIPKADYRWLWMPNNEKMLTPSVEIGSNLNHENLVLLHSVQVSNKFKHSKMLPISDYIRINAPIGSIVEWEHHSGDDGHLVIGNSSIVDLYARLGYGLNKLTYSITKPGNVTIHKEQWIRVPYKMISKGKLEYQSTYGTVDRNINTSIVSTKVDYGLINRVSVGIDQTTSFSGGIIKDRYGASMVWAPTRTSDFFGRWSTDSNYLLTSSIWIPQYGSIELTDFREKAFLDPLRRPTRRQSTIRVSLNGNRIFRYQFGYVRTEYNDATSMAVESNANASYLRWLLSTHISHRRWDNLLSWSSHQTDFQWNLGYRFRNRLIITSDVQSSLSDRFEFQSFRVSTYFNTSSYQLGGNITSYAPFSDLTMGFSARVSTDRLTVASRTDLHGRPYYGSHAVSTSWMKSRKSEWHPTSQTSEGSSGLVFIPFHDRNENGIKESNEEELTGLSGSVREGHTMGLRKSPNKLMFSGLQPYRKYEITLETDLRNDPSYLVQSTTLHVDTPGSGYRLIYVPVVTSFEIVGRWELSEGSTTRPGYNELFLTKTDGSHSVRGTLFSDGTWIIDKIGAGSYAIQIGSNGTNTFATSPKFLNVVHDKTTEYPLITITSQS